MTEGLVIHDEEDAHRTTLGVDLAQFGANVNDGVELILVLVEGDAPLSKVEVLSEIEDLAALHIDVPNDAEVPVLPSEVTLSFCPVSAKALRMGTVLFGQTNCTCLPVVKVKL